MGYPSRDVGMEAPLDSSCSDEWQRAMDNMSDPDLDTDGDPGHSALTAGLLRKRPDGFAVNWGHKTVLIHELTRAIDSRGRLARRSRRSAQNRAMHVPEE